MHLSWARTVIRGQAGACNFTASFLGSKAGRIYKPNDTATQAWHAFASGFNLQTNRVGSLDVRGDGWVRHARNGG